MILSWGFCVCIPSKSHTAGWVSGESGRVSHVDLSPKALKLEPLSVVKASAHQISMLKPSRGKPCYHKLGLDDRSIGDISYGLWPFFCLVLLWMKWAPCKPNG